MKTTKVGIQVGHLSLPKEVILDIAKGITEVLQAGFNSHSDQETVRKALETFSKLTGVENVHISGSNIRMGD